eukprot:TRINITY_DN941_c2_g1_i1.p1 TRINITY_DN941_c2_g1~~TRINITY_DN941_c2_g1_i1.p1  ORF type:complete len:185 (+),score=54.55 TRINITY_DN941_c2_g1_i1:359-913(+)
MVKINSVEKNDNNKEVLELQQNHWKIFNCEKKIIELTDCSPRQSIVIVNSNELVIKVPNGINHIDISNCKNIHLIFQSVISFIEITRSYNVKIDGKSFNTLQIDMSDNIYVPIRNEILNLVKVVSEGSTNIFLYHSDDEKMFYPIERQDTQTVTHFNCKEKCFKTVTSESLKKDGSNFILLSSL